MKILQVGNIKLTSELEAADHNYEPLPGLGYDGPSRNLLGLSKALADLGHRVAILHTTKAPRKLLQAVKGVQFIQGSVGHTNPWWCSTRAIQDVSASIGDPHFVNFHSVYSPYQVALARRFAKAKWPYVVTPRSGLNPFNQARHRAKKSLANWAFYRSFLRNANGVVALCNQEQADIKKYDPTLRTIVCPNGVSDRMMMGHDCTEATVFPTLTGKNVVLVGYLGRLDVGKKGLDLLLGAISKVQHERKAENLRFVVAGHPTSRRDARMLDALVNNLPFPERVLLVGPKYNREKWETLKAFDVFVHTSRTEGMPTAVLEAMSFAKPCLLTDKSNMTHIVKETGGGWACATEVTSVAAALTRASATGKQELVRRGKRNRDYVRRNMRWETVADNYVKNMQALLSPN